MSATESQIEGVFVAWKVNCHGYAYAVPFPTRDDAKNYIANSRARCSCNGGWEVKWFGWGEDIIPDPEPDYHMRLR